MGLPAGGRCASKRPKACRGDREHGAFRTTAARRSGASMAAASVGSPTMASGEHGVRLAFLVRAWPRRALGRVARLSMAAALGSLRWSPASVGRVACRRWSPALRTFDWASMAARRLAGLHGCRKASWRFARSVCGHEAHCGRLRARFPPSVANGTAGTRTPPTSAPGAFRGVLAAQSPARSTTQLPMAHRKASRAAGSVQGALRAQDARKPLIAEGKFRKFDFLRHKG